MTDTTPSSPHTDFPAAVCPFVGLSTDPGSLLAYPSRENLCLNCRPPVSPVFSHQEQFCLTAEHTSCAAYSSGVLPLDARPPDEPVRRQFPWRRFGQVVFWGVVLAGLAVAAIFVFQSLLAQQPALPALAEPVASSTNGINSQTSSQPESTPISSTATVAPTATFTPEPTATVTQPPVLRRLYMPIGPEGRQFVAHRIVDGDNIERLLEQYGTSLEALQAINLRLPLPIWINYIAIFPYQTTDVTGVPYLTAVEVTGESISIDDLAARLETDAALLRSLNDCPEGCLLLQGDWVIAPREP